MRKLLISFIILVGVSFSADARSRVFGWAQKGNEQVKTSPSTTYKLNSSYPGCTITVYLAGTTTLAVIYSNNTGTGKSNPFTADTNAFWFFYIDDGKYDVKFSGTGIVTPFTIGDVTVFDNTVSYASTTTRGLIELDTAPVSSTSPVAVGTNSEKVLNVQKAFSPINYGGVPGAGDNTTAIRAAISAAQGVKGGFVVIPAGVWNVNSTLVIPSHIIITGTGTTDGGSSPSVLQLTTGSIPLLEVDSDFRFVAIRDLELRGPATSGSTGILLTGRNPNSAFGFELHSVAINGFDIGINVLSTHASWELEQITIDHCLITGIGTYGIQANSINTSWIISNTVFGLVAGGVAIQADEIGDITLDTVNVLGVANVVPYCDTGLPSSSLALALLRIDGDHTAITIKNSETEGVGYFLIDNLPSYNSVVNLISNVIQGRVEINESAIINSYGNWYRFQELVRLHNSAIFTSIGDATYTFNNETDCGVDLGHPSIYTDIDGTAVVPFESNWFRFNIFKTPGAVYEKTGTDLPASTPLFSLGSDVANKTFLRFGQTNGNETFVNYYDMQRDSNGFATINGSQAIPNRGLSINGGFELYGNNAYTNCTAGRALLNYNAGTNLLQWCQNGDSVFRTFIGATTVLTTNRLARISDGTTPTIANSIISDNGFSLSIGGAATLSTGNLTVTSGNVLVPAGNVSVTTGNIATNAGNITTAAGNISTNSGRIYSSATVVFTNLDATPSVLSANFFKTNNGSATNITMFDDGVAGQIIYVLCGDANTTIVDGGNLKLGSNLACTADDTMSLFFNGTNWYELSRSVN